MAAPDGDAVLQPHQFRQQFTARNHRDLQPARFLHFRIRLIHRRTHHQRLRARHIGSVVTLVNGGPQLRQPFCGGREFQV